MTQNKEVRWVPLGEIIRQRREKFSGELLPIRGVSREGFIPPKQKEADYSKYNVFYFNDFVFNPARMELNSIALNTELEKGICSSLYEIFFITDEKFLPSYVNIFIKRDEFARHCEYIGSGSAREYCRVANISELKIPVPYKEGEPDVDRQQEIVDVWQGLRRLKEENEALAKPLMELCDAKMDELKHSAPMVELGNFIEQRDERNKDNKYNLDNLQGVSIDKKFIPTKANMEGVKLTPYKLVYPFDFCYVNITSRNGEKITLALNQSNQDYIVSSSYIVFRVTKKNDLDPTFLYLWFCRSEFDRYSRFNSWGSAREAFSWEEMCLVKVPKPSLEVQKAIVDIYHCARRAKEIAAEADKQLKEICPALMQHIIHS